MTTNGKTFPVLARAFSRSRAKRSSSHIATTHHLLRHLLSAAWPQRSDQPCRSTEFQRDKNSAKISTDSSRCFGSVSYGLHGRLQSGCSNLTLPKCRSLSTSPWDLEGEPAVGEDLRHHR